MPKGKKRHDKFIVKEMFMLVDKYRAVSLRQIRLYCKLGEPRIKKLVRKTRGLRLSVRRKSGRGKVYYFVVRE